MFYDTIFSDNYISLYGAAALPEHLRPYPRLSNVICFALPIPAPIAAEIKKSGPSKTYFHHYRTVNAMIDQVSYRLILAAEKDGYAAIYVPASQSTGEDGLSGLFSHKIAGVLCGLGGIGQNGLLVTKEYGCSVRLGSVLTDHPVKECAVASNPCTGCGICVNECPTGALYGIKFDINDPAKHMLDALKCSRYMKAAYRQIGRGSVCGVCFAVCPQDSRMRRE